MLASLITGAIMGVSLILVVQLVEWWMNRQNGRSPSDYPLSTGASVGFAAAISLFTGLIFGHGIFWMIACAAMMVVGYRFLRTKVWHK